MIIFLSCKEQNSKATVSNQTDTIPIGAIPFEYDKENKRAILLEGFLNDSISVRVLFDTGLLTTNQLIVSDSLKDQFISNDSIPLKIGEFNKLQSLYFEKKDNYFFNYFSSNTVCLGWNYFNGKIIEISYKQKYIRELYDEAEFKEFKRLKVNLYRRSLGVLIEVYLQGKKIQEEVLLDTGFNGAVDFNANILSRYNINTDRAQSMRSQNAFSEVNKYFLQSDSVKLGKMVKNNYPIGFLTNDKGAGFFSGICGNLLLDDYTLILDLKNYYLYLK